MKRCYRGQTTCECVQQDVENKPRKERSHPLASDYDITNSNCMHKFRQFFLLEQNFKNTHICRCCCAYLFSCHQTSSGANYWMIHLPFSAMTTYFVIGGIPTCSGLSDDPMFLRISSKFCPLNLLLVQSNQAKIIIVKRFITDQGHNSVTTVRVQQVIRPFDQGCRKNNAFTILATLPTFATVDQFQKKLLNIIRSIIVQIYKFTAKSYRVGSIMVWIN